MCVDGLLVTGCCLAWSDGTLGPSSVFAPRALSPVFLMFLSANRKHSRVEAGLGFQESRAGDLRFVDYEEYSNHARLSTTEK